MKRKGFYTAAFFLALSFPLLFSCCGTGGLPGSDGRNISGSAHETHTRMRRTFEILWQQGGDEGYVNPVIEKLKHEFPDFYIKVDYSPKVHDLIRPRLVAGNPPDLFSAHQSFFNYINVIKEDQLLPVDDILNSRLPNSDKELKDIFQDGILDIGFVDGRHYLLPDRQFFNGFWYNKQLFEDKGWRVPVTWNEFLDFCETVKNSENKIAPFGYAGLSAPFYLSDSFVLPSIAYLGGEKAIDDINNLRPGAWKSQAVIDTARRIALMVSKNYMHEDSLSINHIQSEMMFMNNEIAILPIGSWMKSEAKKYKSAEGFKLTYMVPPLGDEKNIYIVANNSVFAIPKQSGNIEVAKKFAVFYYSENAMERMARDYNTLLPLRDLSQYGKFVLPEEILHAVNNDSDRNAKIIGRSWTYWYKTLDKRYMDLITQLVSQDISPEEFAEEMENEAERIRRDNSIYKYRAN